MILDDQTRLELVSLVKQAVNEAVEENPLSPDEVHWVRMAIEAEANRAAFRKAVIEKTFVGLVSAGVLALGTYIVRTFLEHWK